VSTIKSSREIDAIFRAARRAAHPLLIALVTPTPKERGLSGRVAFVAGKKLGGAVDRNRCRRVMRESVRRCGGPWPGWDVVLIARPPVARVACSELDNALKTTLAKVRVL
jgi:ribonuclease P protein component